MRNSTTNARIVKHFFTRIAGTDSKWRCICGNEYKQRDNKGYTNLLNHLKAEHANYETTALGSSIVKYPDFESGGVKIIDKAHDSLTKDEEFTCKLLSKDVEGSLAVITSTGDFARDEIERKRQRMQVTDKYRDCTFIEPTSNRLERLFSTAGYCCNDLRQSITPVHFEEQLFLKINHQFWDSGTVNDAMAKSSNGN